MGVTPAKRGVGSISVADGSDRGAGAPYRTEGIEYLGNAAMNELGHGMAIIELIH